jgi:hypothetical protein
MNTARSTLDESALERYANWVKVIHGRTGFAARIGFCKTCAATGGGRTSGPSVTGQNQLMRRGRRHVRAMCRSDVVWP